MKAFVRRRLVLPVRSLVLLVGLLGFVAVAGGLGRPAHAATTVTYTRCPSENTLDLDVGNSNVDRINFQVSGLLCTITLTRGPLAIDHNLTMDASSSPQGVVISGGDSLRVLVVDRGVTFTLNAFTIAHGLASSLGGGLLNQPGGLVTISNSTFADNSASLGGGIYNEFGGTVSISNSTFAHNSAKSTGGGIYNEFGSTVNISNSTFANNSAGGGFANNGTMSLGGSIVANNTGGNCLHFLTDQGDNLSSDSSCGFTASTSLQNTDPKLDPNGLQHNGGPTQTIALQPDSPAVEHIPSSSCLATDQRGVVRPQGPACDTGAFEMTAADGVTVMIHVVDNFPLEKALQTSLDAKLTDALKAVKAGETTTACSDLSDFIGRVQGQWGKGLTTAQATQLVNEAIAIQTRLGC